MHPLWRNTQRLKGIIRAPPNEVKFLAHFLKEHTLEQANITGSSDNYIIYYSDESRVYKALILGPRPRKEGRYFDPR